MRILFVRHGHPDYEHDCLTPLGHLHAEAAATRLKEEGISAVYTSTCGRAEETAGYTARMLGLTPVRCDFMREINWGGAEGRPLPLNGHPWDTADHLVALGEPLMDSAWADHPPFADNIVVDCVRRAGEAADAWLAGLGYRREGHYYRSPAAAPDTIAAFGHGGSFAAILGHLFNLPFPFVCAAMGFDYTGITAVELPLRPGELVLPRFAVHNDARHIRGMKVNNYFGR